MRVAEAALLCCGLGAAAAVLPGCYVDDASQRLLGKTICEKTGGCTALTLEYCAAACRALHYGVAGVEAGHACYCDHALPATARKAAAASECNATCSGTTSPGIAREACGGSLRLFAYNATTTPLPPPPVAPSAFPDTRDITQAKVVFQAGYVDQTYCAALNRSAWSCVLTASLGGEGSSGEQTYATQTFDGGATWTDVATIEAGIGEGGLPNAYATVAADGRSRLHAIYNLNVENTSAPGRNDLMGGFFRRYSDDGGATWSRERYAVPTPTTALDRANTFKGKTKMLWTVDQVKTVPGWGAGFAFTKIGGYVENPPEEVFIMRSPNLLEERENQSAIKWEMVPAGDRGLVPPPAYSPASTVIEEPKLLPLPNGTGCTVVTRSNRGVLFAATTRDPTARGGWNTTVLARYADPLARDLVPLGDFGTFTTAVKSSRAPFTAKWIPGTDRLLLLFYNSHADGVRNPYWLAAGTAAADGAILWSQPEVAIYDRSYPSTGTAAGGYPDFVFQDGVKVMLAQKGMPTHVSTMYLVSLDDAQVRGLLDQRDATRQPDRAGLALACAHCEGTFPRVAWPDLLDVTAPRQGFSVSLKLEGHGAATSGAGLLEDDHVKVVVGSGGAARLLVTDDRNATFDFSTDPACASKLSASAAAHAVTVVVDAAAHLASFVVDGVLCDGGGAIGYGWKWLPASLSRVAAGGNVTLARGYAGAILEAQLHLRTLSTSEVVAMHRDWLL